MDYSVQDTSDAAFTSALESLLDGKYAVKYGHRCTTSQTGEAFKEISLSTLEQEHLAPALAGILKSLGEPGDTLYWLVVPGFDSEKGSSKKIWKAYTCCLVSAKPVLYPREIDNPSYRRDHYTGQARPINDVVFNPQHGKQAA